MGGTEINPLVYNKCHLLGVYSLIITWNGSSLQLVSAVRSIPLSRLLRMQPSSYTISFPEWTVYKAIIKEPPISINIMAYFFHHYISNLTL